MKHLTSIATSSITDEHATPEWILEFCRRAMGTEQFAFDPFTTPDNPTNAKSFCYIPRINGFTTPWWAFPTTFINPPFSKMLPVVDKLHGELGKGSGNKVILLAKADFRTKWSKKILQNTEFPPDMVVVNSYVKFGEADTSAVFSVVLYCYNCSPVDIREACREDFKQRFWYANRM